GAWRSWLHLIVAGGTLAAAVAAIIVVLRPVRGLATGALAGGVVSSLVLPAAWALGRVLVPRPRFPPAAGIAPVRGFASDVRVASRFIDPTGLATLIDFLQTNRGKERYLLATSSTTLAAPIIIETGQPVMARGGFHGLDPILTPEKLARLVE